MQVAQSALMEPLLATMPLFRSLGSEVLSRIAQGAHFLHVDKGEFLFHKGDECRGIHLIVQGQIKLIFSSAIGNNKVAEILGQGQTFGEALMFADKHHFVTAQATRDALLLCCPKALVFKEIDEHAGLRLRMLATMSIRLHQLVAEIETLSFHSGAQRVIGYLLRELPEGMSATDAVVALPASKGNIASRLKLTQEHFSRILSDLSSRGLLVVQGRRILIPDVNKLQAYQAQATALV